MKTMAGSSIKMVPLPGVGTVGGLEKLGYSLNNATNASIAEKYNKSTAGKLFENSSNNPNSSGSNHTNNISNQINVKVDQIDNGRALAGTSHTVLRGEADRLMNTAYNSANSNNLQGAQDAIGSLAKTLLDTANVNGRFDEKVLREAIHRAGLNKTKLGWSIYQAGKNGQGSNQVIQDMGADINKLKTELSNLHTKQQRAPNDLNAAYTENIHAA